MVARSPSDEHEGVVRRPPVGGQDMISDDERMFSKKLGVLRDIEPARHAVTVGDHNVAWRDAYGA